MAKNAAPKAKLVWYHPNPDVVGKIDIHPSTLAVNQFFNTDDGLRWFVLSDQSAHGREMRQLNVMPVDEAGNYREPKQKRRKSYGNVSMGISGGIFLPSWQYESSQGGENAP